MVEANEKVFLTLEKHCARREQPIPTAGLPRFLYGDDDAKAALKGLRLERSVRFGNHRSLLHLAKADDHYVALVGFEVEPDMPQLTVLAHDPGFTVSIICFAEPEPTASPAAIRDVVEVGSMRDGDEYEGHTQSRIESLFPRIQVFACADTPDEDIMWRLFLMMCVEECERGGSWIGPRLASSLLTLTDLDVPSFPYPAVCYSMFDADPRTLFMALYRCIEATYAYESSSRIVRTLGLSVSWSELAESLEREVGWHPREASSLNAVLRVAVEADLRAICDLLGASIGDDVAASAGKAIYRLRNRIVHFRPGLETISMADVDWNRLCDLLIGVVFDVFMPAYGPATK